MPGRQQYAGDVPLLLQCGSLSADGGDIQLEFIGQHLHSGGSVIEGNLMQQQVCGAVQIADFFVRGK
jgi:hypothetical protein